MSIVEQVNADIKQAMLAKEKEKLEALRAVKSALLLLATEKGNEGGVQDAAAISAIQKLVKQRKEAAAIYSEQGRADLAEVEESQADTIAVYLPAQMSEAEIEAAVEAIIAETGASSMADMGKVMGAATKKLAGKADGKVISGIVRKALG